MKPGSIIETKTVLPPATVSIAGGVLLFGGFGPNSLLALLAVAVLFLGSWLLWRPGESPILLFVFGFQWLQASTKVFHANWRGLPVSNLGDYGGNVWLAIVLSLLGLVGLVLGMRLGAGPWRPEDGSLARRTAVRYEPKPYFHLYAIAFLVAGVAESFAWIIPGLTQPLLAVARLKWAFYWMLAYVSFAQPKATRLYLLLALGLELATSFGGYFSDFKTVLFITALATLAAGVRLSRGQYLVLFGLAGAALLLGVTWTAIKSDYRSFVSGGAKAQVVTVTYPERIAKLAELVGQLDANAMAEASEQLLQRLAYVDFFGVVLDTVPELVPHEDGALWWDAISRPFMPRLLFPNKTEIDDSVRTRYYTGIQVAGQEEGTSISIGYMAESYIDFGATGMMIPIFVLGLLLGGFYRCMLRLDASRRFVGMALATATIYGASYIETSISKFFGGVVVMMLVSLIVLRFLAPRFFPWIRNELVR